MYTTVTITIIDIILIGNKTAHLFLASHFIILIFIAYCNLYVDNSIEMYLFYNEI